MATEGGEACRELTTTKNKVTKSKKKKKATGNLKERQKQLQKRLALQKNGPFVNATLERLGNVFKFHEHSRLLSTTATTTT